MDGRVMDTMQSFADYSQYLNDGDFDGELYYNGDEGPG